MTSTPRPSFVSSFVMEEAPGYIDWTTSLLASHITNHVLEVGCGAGLVAHSVLRLPGVTQLTAIDPSPHAITATRARCDNDERLRCLQKDLANMNGDTFDSIVCCNVLEHIDDDLSALQQMHTLLRPDGTLALLVPAHPFLYTAYDKDAGHFRRYTKRTLSAVLHEASFTIDRMFYCNALGAVGWLVVNGMLCRFRSNEKTFRSSARSFERYALPVVRRLEVKASPPFGLSVIALCTKS